MSLGGVLPFIHFHFDTRVDCSGLVQHFLLKREREIQKKKIYYLLDYAIFIKLQFVTDESSPLFWRQRTLQLLRWLPSPAPPDLPALPAAAPNPVAATSSLTRKETR